LRREPTDAEKKLGTDPRPQLGRPQVSSDKKPIGSYVVDFVCRERRLVIEVDGGQHATDTRDAVRDQWLAEHRYRVLRFWNNDGCATWTVCWKRSRWCWRGEGTKEFG